MIETIAHFLNSQPFITLFLVIGIGYAVGKINIGGFSLGIGAVLFVGLAFGAIAPNATPPGLLGLMGLVLFLYGIGIQYGRHFFSGLASSFGIKANLLAAIAVLAGFGTAVLLSQTMHFSSDFAAGMFAGSLTSTASLQAAIDVSGNNSPAVAYAIAYPFGVFGPMIFFYLALRVFKPNIDVQPPKRLATGELNATTRNFTGLTVDKVMQQLPKQVNLLAIRRNEENLLPANDLQIDANDMLLIAGYPEHISMLQATDSDNATQDRHNLDYVRMFVSKEQLIGVKLRDIALPKDISVEIIQVRRGDNDLLAKPDLELEYGDQLGILVEPSKKEQIRKLFGDSINAEFQHSFVAMGLGIAVGAMIGLIPFPIPGVGVVKFGIAGGVLIMSLVLGYVGRLGPLNWSMPIVANTLLRNFGLTLFLASVGISSGAPFVDNIAGAGLSIFFAGIIELAVVVLAVILLGHFIFKIKFDELLGIASGATGNPAILAYGNQLAPTGRPEICYAMIFPGVGTILKIILVQFFMVI
ncbi:aspartate:alanine exchanger family transporter [Motilimonas sp. KMU-193]|uniref:aspartate:alanine exchanger family transporter n=1 Tax=Motilimonas sp. KMU-193 TaxID=3388668 RepID=UPI00396B19F4